MDDTDMESTRGGRVRKKSQKLLEMEDFASAWKQQKQPQPKPPQPKLPQPKLPQPLQQPQQQLQQQANMPSAAKQGSARKKSVTGKVTTREVSEASGGGSVETVGTVGAPGYQVGTSAQGGSTHPHRFSETEKTTTTTTAAAAVAAAALKMDADTDWEMDEGYLDGTPANPKIIIRSNRTDEEVDGGANSSLVITKRMDSTTADVNRHVSVDPQRRNLSVSPIIAANKRPDQRPPEKVPTIGVRSPVKPPPTLIANSPLASFRPPPTPTATTASTALSTTTTTIREKQRSDFEAELLKADLALRKRKLVKKVKPEVAIAASTSFNSETSPSPGNKTEVSLSRTKSIEVSDRSLGGSDGRNEGGNGDDETAWFRPEGAKDAAVETKRKKKKEKRKKEKKHRRENVEKGDVETSHGLTKTEPSQSKGKESGKRNEKNRGGETDERRGFILFCKTARREVRKEFPSISFSDITKVAVERWNGLSVSERADWTKKANQRSIHFKVNALKVSKDSSKNRVVAESAKPHGPKMRYLNSKLDTKKRLTNKQLFAKRRDAKAGKSDRKSSVKSSEPTRLSDAPRASSTSHATLPLHDQNLAILTSSLPPPTAPPDISLFVPAKDLDYSSISVASSSAPSSTSADCVTSGLDTSAYIKLLGESLTVIGMRLTGTTTPLAVQGGLSVLMDSLLCATVSLTTLLTSELPEFADDAALRATQARALENAAYIMPGM